MGCGSSTQQQQRDGTTAAEARRSGKARDGQRQTRRPRHDREGAAASKYRAADDNNDSTESPRGAGDGGDGGGAAVRGRTSGEGRAESHEGAFTSTPEQDAHAAADAAGEPVERVLSMSHTAVESINDSEVSLAGGADSWRAPRGGMRGGDQAPTLCEVEPIMSVGSTGTGGPPTPSPIADDFVTLLHEKVNDLGAFVQKHGLVDPSTANAVAARFERVLPASYHEALGMAFGTGQDDESLGETYEGPSISLRLENVSGYSQKCNDGPGGGKVRSMRKHPAKVVAAKGGGEAGGGSPESDRISYVSSDEGDGSASTDSVGSHASNVSRVLEDLGKIGSVRSPRERKAKRGKNLVLPHTPSSPSLSIRREHSPRSPSVLPRVGTMPNRGRANSKRHDHTLDTVILQLLVSAGSLIKYCTTLTTKADFISSVAQQVNELIQSDSCTIYELEVENEKQVLRTVVDKGTGCSFSACEAVEATGEWDVVDLPVEGLAEKDPLRHVVDHAAHVHAAPHDASWAPNHFEKFEVYDAIYHPIVHDDTLLGVCKVAKQSSVDPESLLCLPGLKDLMGSVLVFVGAVMSAFSMSSALKAAADRTSAMMSTIEALQAVDISDFNLTAHKIMEHAQMLVNCESCEVYLVNKENGTLSGISRDTHQDPVAIHATLPGVCVTSGEMLNIPDLAAFGHDAHLDPLFGLPGLSKPQSYLAVPIKTLDGDVLGVFQFVNKYKDDDDYAHDFSPDDTHSVEIFTSFASMCLRTASLIRFLQQSSQQSSKLMNTIAGGGGVGRPAGGESKPGSAEGVLRKLQDAEVGKVLALELSLAETSQLDTIGFPVESYYIGNTDSARLPSLIVHMFEANGRNSTRTFGTTTERLVSFILEVRRRYRVIPYHNFTHAFDVLQATYMFINALPKGRYLSEVDEYVLLVTALCHDIDHAGLNNGFHLKAETPLGVLHSAAGTKSVMEIHHCNLTIDILSNPETNVFEGLASDESRNAYRAVIECILGTDMTRHGEIIGLFEEAMLNYDAAHQPHKRVFMTMLLKAADISNIARPFDLSKSWGKRVTKEFKQVPVGGAGDPTGPDAAAALLPRKQSYSKVREDAETLESLQELCRTQLSFIDGLGHHMYRVVGQRVPELAFLADLVTENRERWKVLEGELAASAAAATEE